MGNPFFLFSVENNYDQPDNNLVAWWKEKPSLESIAAAIGTRFPGKSDEETVLLVALWHKGGAVIDNTAYRLESHPEGVINA